MCVIRYIHIWTILVDSKQFLCTPWTSKQWGLSCLGSCQIGHNLLSRALLSIRSLSRPLSRLNFGFLFEVGATLYLNCSRKNMIRPWPNHMIATVSGNTRLNWLLQDSYPSNVLTAGRNGGISRVSLESVPFSFSLQVRTKHVSFC